MGALYPSFIRERCTLFDAEKLKEVVRISTFKYLLPHKFCYQCQEGVPWDIGRQHFLGLKKLINIYINILSPGIVPLFTGRGQAEMAAVTVERKTEVGKVWLSEGVINLTNDPK